MSYLDWFIMLATISGIVFYGLKKSRGRSDLDTFLGSGKEMKWLTIGFSIIATQASAITFLSTPGQGYDDGMGFVQLYFGLPIAMVVLAVAFVPLFHRLKIQTAYEFLEKRFDFKTRALGAFLFLVQRGLAVGFTIYAPSLVFSHILGWNIYLTTLAMGLIVIFYTVSGGSRAVSYVHRQQMIVILVTLFITGFLILDSMPKDISFREAVTVADKMGKMNTLDWSFDLTERYNIWSGVLGGFFLAMAYFGTDQTQVQRYLGGKTIKASRIGLLFNGIVKVPFQYVILFMGVMLFVYYQFEKPPIFFNESQREKVYNSEYALDLEYLETQQVEIFEEKKQKIRRLLDAEKEGNKRMSELYAQEIKDLDKDLSNVKDEAVRLIAMNNPGANTNDLDQIFITFVTQKFPKGIIGLLVAIILSASMSSAASILSALAGISVIDIYKRIFSRNGREGHYLKTGKIFTVIWGSIAILFAFYANFTENLIEAVNILGSLFYGTILGIFLIAFFIKKVKGNATFYSACIAQLAVLACFFFTNISYLWYNVIGSLLVIMLGLGIQVMFFPKETSFTAKDYHQP